MMARSRPARVSRFPTPAPARGGALLLALAAVLPASGAAQQRAPLLESVSYRYIGADWGGRVTAVAGHAAQPSTFYFGGVGGGVFRTDDAGATWRNLTDGQIPVGSIGAVKVAPSNPDILWVGTGSAAIRSNVSIGKGVYRSLDGGRTWSFAGLDRAGVIGDMAIHPTNPEVAFVAAVGNPFAPNPERGIFRTRDGGQSWTRVLYVSDSTGASDIAMNPANPDELYAGMWRAERKPWTIISGAREGGVYKSTDGGESWRKLTSGLPAGYTGKISVSVSPANPRRVYALMEAGDGTLGPAGGVDGGLYRSDDAGASWTRVSADRNLINRPFYYTYVDADPQDQDMVYVNNLSFFRSSDGGATWERIPTPHGDNHGIWINPERPEIFIQANDGGVNITLDGGRTWSPQTNQPTAEYYQVDLDDRWPFWVYAGQQDRSTIGVPSTGARSEADWRTDLGGCETGPAVPKPGSNAQIFFSSCKGRFYRHSEISGQTVEYSVGAANMYGHNPADLKYRFQRVSPIVVSPHDPNTVYHASQYLHRTRDEGRTWETISPDLTANDPRGHVISGAPITRDITGEEFYSTLYAVAESPLERGVLWTGANDGPIHVSRDDGRTWVKVTPPQLPPGGRVQTIEASPHRRGSAYVAVLRYMFDDWRPHLYRTDDYGATWTPLSEPASGFPQDHPTRVVREDPDREGLLYAGTEFGSFLSYDNGRSWHAFQRNLPATPVTDMKVFRKRLVLSTQGRGFWIIDDLTPIHEGDRVDATRPHLFTPREAYRGPRGEGAVLHFHLPAATPGAVTLEFRDASGRVVASYSSEGAGESARTVPGMRADTRVTSGAPRLSASAGTHTFEWNLREGTGAGAGRGLAVPPGRYTAQLQVPGGAPMTAPVEVRLHPDLMADGISAADLEARYALGKQVQELAEEARALRTEVESARQAAGRVGDQAREATLARLEERIVTRPGQSYAQPMLLDQISYLNAIVSRGDDRPHSDAFTRHDELRAEAEVIRRELRRASP